MANKCLAYEIRTAFPGDARVLAEVQVASWRAAYKGLMPQSVLDDYTVEGRTERWTDILALPSAATTTVAEFNGLVDAFVSYGPCREEDSDAATTGEIWALYAHPSSWGQGVGHTLCTYALDALRASGASSATLWVLNGNGRAIRFYEKFGFRPDGATQSFEEGSASLQEVRYVLDL